MVSKSASILLRVMKQNIQPRGLAALVAPCTILQYGPSPYTLGAQHVTYNYINIQTYNFKTAVLRDQMPRAKALGNYVTILWTLTEI